MSGRCLIVDPSAMVRRVASRIVRELGYAVSEAATGQEALSACASRLPDVILLDWKTPDMETLDLIGAVRASAASAGDPMPTLIFCTADRSVDRIVEALQAGADEYIMKPFDSDIIRAKFELAGLPTAAEVPCEAA
ncbi:MAG: response regulator [Litorimonas sp.]